MAKDFSRAFYHSLAWKRTRDAYFRSRHGLCERCLSRGRTVPGEIVHHRVHLDPANIRDASVALGFGNLELLCRECHAAEHSRDGSRMRVEFDENGNVTGRADG